MLTVANLSLSEPGGRSIRSLRIAAGTGAITALIGASGSGKSRVLRAIVGITRPVRGSIQIDGIEIADLTLRQVVRRGLAFVPQGGLVVDPLTVSENLELSAAARRGRIDSRRDEVFALFPALVPLLAQRAGMLAQRERLMLAIGRAVMTRPSIIVIDQPSHGLPTSAMPEVARAIAGLRALEYTVLLAEQNVSLALDLCDYAYVLRAGALVASGTPDQLRDSDAAAEAFLG
jgi:branched-chain amino acid transport system ATP-binding protein